MFRKINKSAEEFEEKFWKSKSAETFYNSLPSTMDNPMAQLFKDSMQVVMKSRSKTNLSQRLENILETNINIDSISSLNSYPFNGILNPFSSVLTFFPATFKIVELGLFNRMLFSEKTKPLSIPCKPTKFKDLIKISKKNNYINTS